jgi:outer membrane protein
MNKVLVAINIILLASIGYLYYYNFSGKKNQVPVAKNDLVATSNDSSRNKSRIAYVELDSLSENLTYLKQQRKDLEQQQKQIEAEITNNLRELEARKTNFYKKNPTATPDQLQSFYLQLQNGQDSLESKKQVMSQVMNQKRFELMESIQKNLKDFLADYNKEKKYQFILTTGSGIDYLIYKDTTLDITKDVIKGMNEKMKPKAY